MRDERIKETGSDTRRQRESLASPIFIVILCTTLCTFLVGQGTNAGTSVYLERIGGEVWLAGIGALCFSVAAAIARLLSGPLTDMRGRQIVICIGAAIMLCGSFGPLLANEGFAFLLWRALQGAGFSAATTALATAAADVLPLSRLGEGIGYYGLGQAISMAIGPALAIFLVSTDPPSNFYLGCMACSIIALTLSLFIRYEKDPESLPATCGYRIRFDEDNRLDGETKETIAEEGKDRGRVAHALLKIFEPKALHGAIPVAFLCAGFSFNIFYMGVFGSSIGVSNSGLYYTICAIVMIVIRLISGKFMDSAPALAIMGVSAGAGVIAFTCLFFASLMPNGEISSMLFYFAGVPFGVCMGLGIPINQAVAVKMSPKDRWGATNGLFQLSIDVANGFLSVLWGFLGSMVGFGAVCICVSVCMVVAFLSALLCYQKEKAPQGGIKK